MFSVVGHAGIDHQEALGRFEQRRVREPVVKPDSRGDLFDGVRPLPGVSVKLAGPRLFGSFENRWHQGQFRTSSR
jgi:hypothetical protein